MSALTVYGVPGKMTRRLAGVVIGTQGLVVFFGALVARALAAVDGSDTSSTPNTFLLLGSALAVLCILDAGMLRRPWGITLGWALQIATLACVFIVPAMLVVGLLFGALWLTALTQGRNMDEHTKRVDAQWYATQESSPPSSAQESSAQESSTQESSTPSSSVPSSSDPSPPKPEPSTPDG